MNETMDFIERLVDTINAIPDLAIECRTDYLLEKEDLVVYALPGGNVISGNMDRSILMGLPYEIAIKTKQQEVANATLWKIQNELSKLNLAIPSSNNSYEFEGLTPTAPSINDRNDKGWYIYTLDVTANIRLKENQYV
jgi:hypothetical protein